MKERRSTSKKGENSVGRGEDVGQCKRIRGLMRTRREGGWVFWRDRLIDSHKPTIRPVLPVARVKRRGLLARL